MATNKMITLEFNLGGGMQSTRARLRGSPNGNIAAFQVPSNCSLATLNPGDTVERIRFTTKREQELTTGSLSRAAPIVDTFEMSACRVKEIVDVENGWHAIDFEGSPRVT